MVPAIVERRAHQIGYRRIRKPLKVLASPWLTNRTVVMKMPALPAISRPGSKIKRQLSGSSLALTIAA